MGNTPSGDNPPPTAQEMRDAEDECASCSNPCDVSSYPKNLKIDRNFVLHDTGKLYRWHILISTGVPATRWPKGIAKQENTYMAAVIDATKQIGGVKFGVSVTATKPVDSSFDPDEVTDLIILPEFIKYQSVPRSSLADLLNYHVNIIAPRHQEYVKAKFEEQQAKENGQTSTDGDDTTTSTPTVINWEQRDDGNSQFYDDADRADHNIGTTLPLPLQIEEETMILLCAHKLRDNRCFVTAELLQQAIDVVLHQKYPSESKKIMVEGVNHVGGHKVAGNLIVISRRHNFSVFYGRVEPQHIENIIGKTIIGGEILAPISRKFQSDLW